MQRFFFALGPTVVYKFKKALYICTRLRKGFSGQARKILKEEWQSGRMRQS